MAAPQTKELPRIFPFILVVGLVRARDRRSDERAPIPRVTTVGQTRVRREFSDSGRAVVLQIIRRKYLHFIWHKLTTCQR